MDRMRVFSSVRARHSRVLAAFYASTLVAACARPVSPPKDSPVGPSAMADAAEMSLERDASPVVDAADDSAPPSVPLEPDGNDDPVDVGNGAIPTHARFERVGRAPLSLTRICGLTPFGGMLYAAHANQPLGTDGATITRFDPDNTAHSFAVAFDWNRPGEPTLEGASGQGFLRVHALGGRLFVPDADPPYAGFGLVDHGTEGYVFISDHAGHFAKARGPHFQPPAPPDAEDTPGAGIIPRAYHVIDAIRFRSRYFVSTGSVPPTERAWKGPSPGALHVASADLKRWTYAYGYPLPWQPGVWRLTYLVRFRGRLLAGIQDYDGREPNDYVLFDPPAGTSEIRREDAHPFDVIGGARTLRWYADAIAGSAARLYWIA